MMIIKIRIQCKIKDIVMNKQQTNKANLFTVFSKIMKL